jgi:hypothetical protein
MSTNVWWLAAGVCLAALGCSGTRPPTAKIAQAEQAVREATEQSEAQELAPLELRLAREKLAEARRAMDDDEHERARRLAEAAYVDAELAEEKANSEKAVRMARETQQSIETLRREAERPVTMIPAPGTIAPPEDGR